MALSSKHIQAFLEVTESIASYRDLPELFHDLAHRLHGVVHFHQLRLLLHDPERNVMRVHILETRDVSTMPLDWGAVSIEESPGGWVWERQEPLIVARIEEETRFPPVIRIMLTQGLKSFCALPLTTAQRRLGALVFGSFQTAAYENADVEFLQQITRQVAVAVDNALNSQRVVSYEQELNKEHIRLAFFLALNHAIATHRDLRDLLCAIGVAIRKVLRCEYLGLTVYEPSTNSLRLHAVDFPRGRGLIHEGLRWPFPGSYAEEAVTAGKPILFTRMDPDQPESFEMPKRLRTEGLKTGCCVPLISPRRALGTLDLASMQEGRFATDILALLSEVQHTLAVGIEHSLAMQENLLLKTHDNHDLSEEPLAPCPDPAFEEIIGQSAALKHVLDQVRTVAPTDSPILLLGETGAGKELVARAIHALSRVRSRSFVKLNCSAIPTGLFESELFGHERGAFTGAITQKRGHFELADGGSLFLDEVGDISLELQPKLLRVLQEQQFERLGGTVTIRVNVRLIAATNADLEKMLENKAFRSDLYHRLKVVPIVVPPLRERREDIPLLVQYFVRKYARLFNKEFGCIGLEEMDAITAYHWPGNVRELDNIVRRATILSPGPELRLPLNELKPVQAGHSSGSVTLEEAERRYIIGVLREVRWVIGGSAGAAARLGLKRTTLQAKMRKLGIARPT